jgi:hypothetical protein
MGGTTLVTKGILSPIEGDVIQHIPTLPLDVKAQVVERSLLLPTEILVQTGLPNAIGATIAFEELGVKIEVPKLDITIGLEE